MSNNNDSILLNSKIVNTYSNNEIAGPNQQAYAEVGQLRGRLINSLANIRLFKNNPYIINLPSEELEEANKDLLTPKNNELFYDDDNEIYVSNVSVIDSETKIEYISKTKELKEKLNYYESSGVLNQLLSAYQNGRVYNFYVDRANLMLYPNANLVFPINYHHYRMRRQELDSKGNPVYVAGIVSDGLLLEEDILMIKTDDQVTGNSYTRMSSSKIFGESRPEDDGMHYDTIEDGKFYIVEFFDENNFIIDTKRFQAIDAAIENIAIPSESIVDLRIEVLRANYPQSSIGGIYPLLSGETLDNNISFNVIGIYGDGTEKILNNYLDTGRLVITGTDQITPGAQIGKQYPVVFTYYSLLSEEGDPIGTPISEKVIFQIVQNSYAELYKIIPVLWLDKQFDNSVLNTYKFKLYNLTEDGVFENRTKSFFDTVKEFKIGLDDENTLIDFKQVPYLFNPYEDCIEFKPTKQISEYIVISFKMYNRTEFKEYRFKMTFQGADSKNTYILPSGDKTSFGYEDGGALTTLESTCNNESAIIYLDTVSDTNRRIILKSSVAFDKRYTRLVSGISKYPSAFQIFAVKDSTYQPLTKVTPFTPGDTTLTGYLLLDDSAVMSIVSNLYSKDKIYVKFFVNTSSKDICLNFDVFTLSRL